MERAVCGWPDARRGLGLAPMGQRIFTTVRRGCFPKLRSKSWVPGAPLLSKATSAQLEPFKNGRNSCRPKHRKTAQWPLSCGTLKGRLGWHPSPASVPLQRKDFYQSKSPFCLSPAWRVERGRCKLPFWSWSCDSCGWVCQLLCRAGRWRDGAFHPAGPRAAGLEASSILAGTQPAKPVSAVGDVAAFFPVFFGGNKYIVTFKDFRLFGVSCRSFCFTS